MADGISEAERIQHGIDWGTRNAIVWTGTIQAIIALATLLWTAWWALREKREEKRTKNKEDDEDKRRQLPDNKSITSPTFFKQAPRTLLRMANETPSKTERRSELKRESTDHESRPAKFQKEVSEEAVRESVRELR